MKLNGDFGFLQHAATRNFGAGREAMKDRVLNVADPWDSVLVRFRQERLSYAPAQTVQKFEDVVLKKTEIFLPTDPRGSPE